MSRFVHIIVSFLTHQVLSASVDALGVIVRDQYLNIPPLATYEMVGLKGCARQCLRRIGHCLAINYEKDQLICHLLDKNRASAPEDLRQKVGLIYSEIDTWTSGELGDPCGSVRCEAGQVCVVLTSGTVTCQFDPTGCPVGKYFNGSGCQLCGEEEYQSARGQFNCSVCPTGESNQWRRPNHDRSKCQGCWFGIGTYTEGDDTARISEHSVADRNECYTLCKALTNCLAVKSTKSNSQCTLFASRAWKYGYVFDSTVVLVATHCRP